MQAGDGDLNATVMVPAGYPDGEHDVEITRISTDGVEQTAPVVIKRTLLAKDLRLVPFTVVGVTPSSTVYATRGPGQSGTVLGTINRAWFGPTTVTSSGLTTIAGKETLVVRFTAQGSAGSSASSRGVVASGRSRSAVPAADAVPRPRR